MGVRPDVRGCLALHAISRDIAAASAGRCGFSHLDSDRVCQLPHRHQRRCQLQDHPETGRPAVPAQRV